MQGSKARAKFEAWKRKQEMNHNTLIARNRCSRHFQNQNISRYRLPRKLTDCVTTFETLNLCHTRKYGDTDMDLSSSSESWDTDTDPYVEWVYNDWNGWREEQGMLCRCRYQSFVNDFLVHIKFCAIQSS